MSSITRRTSALAGIVLGPLFFGVVALLTWAEWDFLRSIGWSLTGEHEVPYPSALGRGDYGVLLSVVFAVMAVLTVVFVIGFRREFRRRVAGRIATFGLGLFAVGALLNTFPADLPDEPSTWHGNIHGIGFLVAVLGFLIGFGASGIALRGNDDWRGWRWLGWTPLLLVVIAFTNLGLPGDVGFYVFLAVAFGWFMVMGAHLLRLSRSDAPVPLARAAEPGLL